jgi:hypothetical protein
MENKLLWWGYLHENGSLQVKRYFDPMDIQEANESPFVQVTFGPWDCENRDEAIQKLKRSLAGG